MAGIKHLVTRIINKHATADVWYTATNFIPLKGELIVYDPSYDPADQKTYNRARTKVGDGIHTIRELPFSNEQKVEVNKTVGNVNVVTGVNTPSYTPAKYNAPSMSQVLEGDTLTLTFNQGSYEPAEFIAGDMPETATIRYLSDVDVSIETPTD